MKKEKPLAIDVDGLLKDALDDNLPAEAERRMQRRLTEFRIRIGRPGQEPEVRPARFWQKLFGPGYRPAGVRWIFNKQSLAFLSIFMLAVGGFLQATGHRSALAESLTSLRTSVSVADSVRQSGFMECRVHVAAEEGVSSEYVIRWIQPGTTRVDVQKAEEVRETLWITNGDLAVIDHLKNVSQKFARLEQLKDSVFQPVLAFLSPALLAENLEQRWQLERFEQESGSHQGTFTFTNHEKGSILKMIVDLGTFLPIQISRLHPSTEKGGPAEELMRLDFTWHRPDSNQGMMLPETLRKNGSSR
jgi:hypothetical protein